MDREKIMLEFHKMIRRIKRTTDDKIIYSCTFQVGDKCLVIKNTRD